MVDVPAQSPLDFAQIVSRRQDFGSIVLDRDAVGIAELNSTIAALTQLDGIDFFLQVIEMTLQGLLFRPGQNRISASCGEFLPRSGTQTAWLWHPASAQRRGEPVSP